MAEIYDLINEIRDFDLFKKMGDLLLFEGNIRSKIWTIEILTNNLNDIIDKFTNSNFNQIESFFIQHLKNLFAENLKKKKKFCYTLILSLIFFKPKNYYLTLYYNFLKNPTPKNVYEIFVKAKNIFFSRNNILTDQNFVNLDNIFLKEKEWVITLNEILHLSAREISNFKEKMTDNLKIIQKKKLPNLNQKFKNQKYSLTFFLSHLINKFCQINDLKVKLEKEKKREEIKISRRSTFIKSNKNSLIIKTEKEKLEEKKLLLKQIKESIKKTNIYRISSARMMCYIKEIDALYLLIRNLFKETREILLLVKKNKIQGKKYEEFTKRADMAIMSFLDRGINLKNKNFKNLQKKLLNKSVDQFKVISGRMKDKIVSVRILIKNLKNRIFKENFSLAKGHEIRNLEKLQSDLEKIFGNFHLKNSDFIILNTYFQNYDTNNKKEMSLGNILEKVGGKIIKMVDIVLKDDEEFNESSQEIENDISDVQFYEKEINKNVDKIHNQILNNDQNMEKSKDFEKNKDLENSEFENENNDVNKSELIMDKDINDLEYENKKNFTPEFENKSFDEKEKSLLISKNKNNDENNNEKIEVDKNEIIDSDIDEKQSKLEDNNEIINSDIDEKQSKLEDNNEIIDSDTDENHSKLEDNNEIIDSDIDEKQSKLEDNNEIIDSDIDDNEKNNQIIDLKIENNKNYEHNLIDPVKENNDQIKKEISESNSKLKENNLEESELIKSEDSFKQRIDSFGIPNAIKVQVKTKDQNNEKKDQNDEKKENKDENENLNINENLNVNEKNPGENQNHESKSTQVNSIQKSNLINNLIDKKKNSIEESEFRFSNLRGDSTILKENIKEKEKITSEIHEEEKEEESEIRNSRITRKSRKSIKKSLRNSFIEKNRKSVLQNSRSGSRSRSYVGIYEKQKNVKRKSKMRISTSGIIKTESILGITNINPKVNSEITNLNRNTKTSINNTSSPMLNIKVNNLEETENDKKLENLEETENDKKLENSEFGEDFGKTILINTTTEKLGTKNNLNHQINESLINTNNNIPKEDKRITNSEFGEDFGKTILIKTEMQNKDNKNKDKIFLNPNKNEVNELIHTEVNSVNSVNSNFTNKNEISKIDMNKNYNESLIKPGGDDFLKESFNKFLPTQQSDFTEDKSINKSSNKQNLLLSLEPEEFKGKFLKNNLNKIEEEEFSNKDKIDKNETESKNNTDKNFESRNDENIQDAENTIELEQTIDLGDTLELENTQDLDKIKKISNNSDVNKNIKENSLNESKENSIKSGSKKSSENQNDSEKKIDNIDLNNENLTQSQVKNRKTLNDYLEEERKILSKISNMSVTEVRKSKIKKKKKNL